MSIGDHYSINKTNKIPVYRVLKIAFYIRPALFVFRQKF